MQIEIVSVPDKDNLEYLRVGQQLELPYADIGYLESEGVTLRLRPKVRLLTDLEHKGELYTAGLERTFDEDFVQALVNAGVAQIVEEK